MSIPPIYKQNSLFHYLSHSHMNAAVGKNGGPYRLDAYSRGYFEATQIQIAHLEKDHLFIDLLIYPITYCYRHAIELGLKHLVETLGLVLGEQTTVATTHLLIDNWKIARSYLERLNQTDEFALGEEFYLFLDNVLDDFVQFDPNAEVFRFPSDRSGNFYLQDSAYINVTALKEMVDLTYVIFEKWFNIAYGEYMAKFTTK